ncbi:MAG: helix-turn-helix transcriptional regulator [Verrucomicrobiaceae bacterium]
MSSRPHSNGTTAHLPPPHPTRSGNGGLLPGSLWAQMEHITDHSALNDREAAHVLEAELNLTQRQAQVLHWVAEGKSNGEIATILGCSINTVKMHLKDIFQRLGIHSRTAATACAYRAHIRHVNHNGPLPERVIPQKRRAR